MNVKIMCFSTVEFMPTKFIAFISIFVLAFTINIHAVDVQVPTRNIPLPGADSSIPANVYEIYTPDSIISDAKNGEFLYPKVDKGIWAITRDERVGTTFQKH